MAALAVAILTLPVIAKETEKAPVPPKVGAKAENFKLPSLADEDVELAKLLKQGPVVVAVRARFNPTHIAHRSPHI